MGIPVVFFHLGNPDYLGLCIQEAKRKNDVILIGDNENLPLGDLDRVKHYNANIDDCRFSQYFLEAYKHMSSGSHKFELLCFLRWAAICRISKKIGLSKIFHSDSDNIVYSNLTSVYEKIGKPKFGLSVPQGQPEFRRSASPNIAYWNIDVLEDFCHYMLDSYLDPVKYQVLEEKWNWHKREKKPGGICDMTVLWHYAQENEHHVLTQIHPDGSTFDHNINGASNYNSCLDEYEVCHNIKKIEFIEGMPYGKNVIENKDVLFHSLHFQGHAKSLISKYTTK
jgi:hypothetical protein